MHRNFLMSRRCLERLSTLLCLLTKSSKTVILSRCNRPLLCIDFYLPKLGRQGIYATYNPRKLYTQLITAWVALKFSVGSTHHLQGLLLLTL